MKVEFIIHVVQELDDDLSRDDLVEEGQDLCMLLLQELDTPVRVECADIITY
jgi:hypothetical protein